MAAHSGDSGDVLTQRPALDLLDGDFYLDPYADYAWFRENDPVAWD